MFSGSDALAFRGRGRTQPWGGLGELLRDDVEQQSFGGCGVWRGGSDRGLHERSGLLPPSAAAPRGPAVPTAGNALVWGRAPSTSRGTAVH